MSIPIVVVTVRVPAELHTACKQTCMNVGGSFNAWAVEAFRMAAVGAKETLAKPTVKVGKKPLEIRTVSANHKDTDDEY